MESVAEKASCARGATGDTKVLPGHTTHRGKGDQQGSPVPESDTYRNKIVAGCCKTNIPKTRF